MGKGILIIVLSGIVVLSIMNMNNNSRLTSSSQVAEEVFSESKAKSICDATAEMLLAQLADSSDFRDSTSSPISWFGGDVRYRVIDTNIGGEVFAKIEVTAEYYNTSKSCKIITKEISKSFIPSVVKAAITSKNDIATLGNYLIDGRDHDIAGNIIANKGLAAIWTTNTYSQGLHPVGGTNDLKVDYVPSNPADPSIIKTGQVWSGSFPSTPDEVIGGISSGFEEGYLKSMAQTGIGGSQYGTSLASITFPLKGITYIEGDVGSTMLSGSGLFVIHNSSTNALIYNCSGSFTGMIIADDIDKFNADLLGAIISITSLPSAAKIMGSGNGSVRFSSEALKVSTINLEKLNSGLGKHRVKILSWLE